MRELLTATIEAAHRAWAAGDVVNARRLFEQAAADGDVGSTLNLGYFHDEGVGGVADKALAMRLYKSAYRRGDAAAASNIAILYREQGRRRLSFQWFARAAKLRDGDAELEVAKLLAAGTGVRKSRRLALLAARRARNSEYITPAGREEAVSLLAALRCAA
jgi:TPR repeat protein